MILNFSIPGILQVDMTRQVHDWWVSR
jgi:hypothetical protein